MFIRVHNCMAPGGWNLRCTVAFVVVSQVCSIASVKMYSLLRSEGGIEAYYKAQKFLPLSNSSSDPENLWYSAEYLP
jgi:hypothetical protein